MVSLSSFNFPTYIHYQRLLAFHATLTCTIHDCSFPGYVTSGRELQRDRAKYTLFAWVDEENVFERKTYKSKHNVSTKRFTLKPIYLQILWSYDPWWSSSVIWFIYLQILLFASTLINQHLINQWWTHYWCLTYSIPHTCIYLLIIR